MRGSQGPGGSRHDGICQRASVEITRQCRREELAAKRIFSSLPLTGVVALGPTNLIDQFSKPIERGVLTKIRVRTRNRTTLQDE
jgi:hypothetical protein